MRMPKKEAGIASVLLLLLSLLGSGGCSQSEPATPAAEKASEESALSEDIQKAWEARGPALMFLRSRVVLLLEERFPAATEKKDFTRARLLCDTGREIIVLIEENRGPEPIDAPTEALFTRVYEYCSVDVSGAILDDLLAKLEEASSEDLETRCTSAQRELVFAMEHLSEDPALTAKRQAVFEKCPELKKQWKIFEEGPQNPPLPPHGP